MLVASRGTDLKTGLPALIKRAARGTGREAGWRFLDHEAKVLRALPELKGLLKLARELKPSGHPAMIFEDFPGIPLAEFFRLSRLSRPDIEVALQIGTALCAALSELHGCKAVHFCLNPDHVLVNPDTLELRLTGLGVAKAQGVAAPKVDLTEWETAMPYISPEQSGRIEGEADARADLYSLGIILFQLLTGALPFSGKDKMEVIHSHIARVPESVKVRNPEVSDFLAGIVAKLLAKHPGDRYQTAASVLRDLKKAAADDTAQMPVKAPRNVQARDRFRIPDKLFGREKTLALMQEALQSAGRKGVAMVTVGGKPGEGKSALVEEILAQANMDGAIFAKGKFAQYDRNTPFIGIVSAFSHLLNRLLSLDDASLSKWREQLGEALGGNLPVLADILPELELILGRQDALNTNESAESLNNRLKKAVKEFVRLFCRPGKPFILFLDDLQWAEASSFDLLRSVLEDKHLAHFLVLGAYRDNEISPGHPLLHFLEHIRNKPPTALTSIEDIHIGPLDIGSVEALLAEIFSMKEAEVGELAKIVLQKTGGNAFFVREFMRRLHQDQFVRFDYELQAWTWDAAAILQVDIADNVVQLMVDKIVDFPAETQAILKLASCFGTHFRIDLLAKLFGIPEGMVLKSLAGASEMGLVVPRAMGGQMGTAYKFAHDLVQQATQEIMDDGERADVHHRIGRHLLAQLDEAQAREQAFDLVYHFSHCIGQLTEKEEKTRFVSLSLVAARRAMAGAAWDQVYQYVEQAIPVAGTPAHGAAYTDLFELQVLGYEAASYSGREDAAKRIYREAMANAATNIDKARLFLSRARAANSASALMECLEACQKGLKLFAINVPRKGSRIGVVIEFLKTQWVLRGKSLEDLYNLPVWEGVEGELVSELLYLSLHPAYVTSPELMGILSLKTLRASIRSGVGPYSFLGFSTFGIFYAVGFNNFKKAYSIMHLGARISEKLGNDGPLINASRAFMQTYGNHIRNSFQFAEKSHRDADEAGLLRDACGPLPIDCVNRFHCGLPLESVEESAHRYLDYIGRSGIGHLYDSVLVVLYQVRKMRGLSTSEVHDFEGTAVGPAELRHILFDTNYLTTRAYYNLIQLQIEFLKGNIGQARRILGETIPIEHSVTGAFTATELGFYKGLVYAAEMREARGLRRMRLGRKARGVVKKIRKWAESAPQNFEHKHLMIHGLVLWAGGKPDEALKVLESAVRSAEKYEYRQNAAMAKEFAARISIEKGDHAQAERFLAAAWRGFRDWGAVVKTRHLEEQYPEYLGTVLEAEAEKLSAARQSSGSVDLRSIYKASRSISGEISLKGVLERLIGILIENAGAERALLLLQQDGELLIQAVGDANVDQVELLEAVPAKGSGRLPESIVNYVSRSRKAVVLHAATISPEYGNDPYIRQNRSKSLLCMPILNQSKLAGILFLENNLTSGAFTRERLDVLDILAAQAAISIENALLYADLEARVETRTRELKQSLEQLRETQDQLIQSEKLASLGQVTAGIAHEIRNPLNFVNNFSELSVEIAAELKEEVEALLGKTLDAHNMQELFEFLDDLGSNAEKIRHHGKRAESIVHNMLLHAASGSGEKQPVALNKLINEYALLAYHAMRGRFPAFSCNLEFDFDDRIGEVALIQQDISRALLNIFQNAYQAMEEKAQDEQAFVPVLQVRTLQREMDVEIRIRDNGPGIPKAIRARIFEPFFTTKSTGKGTGLGLSLVYDLIVQGHGGTLAVDSEPNIFTEFIITLPKQRTHETQNQHSDRG